MHGTQCSDWMLTVWYIASKHVDFGWHGEPNGALLLQAWFLQLPLSIPFFFSQKASFFWEWDFVVHRVYHGSLVSGFKILNKYKIYLVIWGDIII